MMSYSVGTVTSKRVVSPNEMTFSAAPAVAAVDTTFFVVQRDGTFVVQRDSTQVVIRDLVAVWVAAVIANGGTVSSGRQTLIEQLIAGLINDGLWTKLDYLWLFAAENSPSALTDLRKNKLAAIVSTPTFTVDRGYQGNGSTTYVNSNVNLSTAGGLYALNTGHASIWCANSDATGGAKFLGEGTVAIYPRFNGDGNCYARINVGTGGGFAVANTQGHTIGSRTAANNTDTYRNGVSLGSDAAAATFITNFNMCFGYDIGDGIGLADQFAAVTIGDKLIGTEPGNLYARLRTYMTAVGVP